MSGGAGRVVALSRSGEHRFSKTPVSAVRLVEGLGVEGDTHLGTTVQHRSRVAVDPTQPNLRQVHLIHRELLEELAAQGFALAAGDLGENVLTEGLDLLGMPVGTRLVLGEAEVELTGLRNPCAQIERFRPGLLARVVGRDAEGRVVRKAGVMAVVRWGGLVRNDDPVTPHLPPLPHHPLEQV